MPENVSPEQIVAVIADALSGVTINGGDVRAVVNGHEINVYCHDEVEGNHNSFNVLVH